MAKILGDSARYVSQEATKRLHAKWTLCIITMAVAGVLCGFLLRSSFSFISLRPLTSLLLSAVVLLGLSLFGTRSFRQVDQLERERENWARGARGEKRVALLLSKLPDDYRVINDIATPSGNLDHVVVGPTGVFIIETKNWRGIIGPTANGELTHNGEPLNTQYVKQQVCRTMSIRKRVQSLAPEVEAYFQAVFVFTSAWLEKNFKCAGYARCVREDHLLGYILENKPSTKLSASQIDTLARAFSGLAQMDPGFTGGLGGERKDGNRGDGGKATGPKQEPESQIPQ